MKGFEVKKNRALAGGALAAAFFLAGYMLIALTGGEACGRGACGPVVVDGTLETDEVDVSSKLAGRLAEMLVEEGDNVEEGQVLARLECAQVEAKLEQAAAGLMAYEALEAKTRLAVELERRTADSKVEQARAGVAAARAALAMAGQKLSALETGARPQEREMARQAADAAQAAFDAAEKTWNRVRTLADEGVVAQQRADEVEMKYRCAKAQHEAAAARLDMVNEGARAEEIEAARQQVLQADVRPETGRFHVPGGSDTFRIHHGHSGAGSVRQCGVRRLGVRHGSADAGVPAVVSFERFHLAGFLDVARDKGYFVGSSADAFHNAAANGVHAGR